MQKQNPEYIKILTCQNQALWYPRGVCVTINVVKGHHSLTRI